MTETSSIRVARAFPADDESRRTAVLHVTTCFAGGVSRAIIATARATPDRDHHLLASGEDLDAVAAVPGFCTVARLSGGPLRRFLAVRAALRSSSGHVVHAHSSWAGVLVRLAAPRGIEVVYQPHGYAFERPLSVTGFLARLVERVLARRDQQVAVLSPREEQLARRLNPRAHTVLVPNRPSLPRADRHERSAGTGRQRIAMIGRVCPQKDPELFAEVTTIVRERIPEVEAIWIGAGSQEDEERLRRAGVDVTGWLHGPEELAEHVDGVQVVVHSARYEGFPISILDAAARGVPVVAREIPALAGTPIVRAAGAQGIADAVVACLLDDVFARAVARQGARLLEKMSLEEQRDAFDRLYRCTGRRAVTS